MHANILTKYASSVLIAALCITLSSPAMASKRRGSEDAALVARNALLPYLTARSYKGARTVTVSTGSDASKITTSTAIVARCNEAGEIERLRTQSFSWSEHAGEESPSAPDCTLVYNGTTLWVYRPAEKRYGRSTSTLKSLRELLGLPPAEASWKFAARKRADLPEEHAVCATINNEEWILVTDIDSGRLLRVEKMAGKGAQRIATTIALHDIAFNREAEAPESRFVFTPPSGAVEDTNLPVSQ